VAADLRSSFAIDAGRIRTIANPFDLAAIRALSTEPCPARPTTPYILHVGRFAPQKRHDLLLAAFAASNLPQRLLLLTPPDPRLDTLIAQHGLQHRVASADFQANPYPWMAGAELLVLCSDHEGLPNVLIEALACGTRVVSTDCPSGPREILGGWCPATIRRRWPSRWSPRWRRRSPRPRSPPPRSPPTPPSARCRPGKPWRGRISDVRHPARRRRRLPY
jgi:glycosyltransferase involved in cell wall biosynthesis